MCHTSSSLHLDATTVEHLQGRSPSRSREDRRFIETCIADHKIFRTLDIADRSTALLEILSITHVIPSLHTFLEDTKYLEPCSKILRQLFPAQQRGSMHQVFLSLHTGQRDVSIQTDNQTFQQLCLNNYDAFYSGYCQVFLFTMRHFAELSATQPRRDAGRGHSMPSHASDHLVTQLAEVARGSGFRSQQIDERIAQRSDEKLARQFLQAKSADICDFDETVFGEDIRRICDILASVRSKSLHSLPAVLSSDAQRPLKLSERCGRPFQESYTHDRKFLYLQHIYPSDAIASGYSQPDPSSLHRNITTFCVKRDTFCAFFGGITLSLAPANPCDQDTAATISPSLYSNASCTATPGPGPRSTTCTLPRLSEYHNDTHLEISSASREGSTNRAGRSLTRLIEELVGENLGRIAKTVLFYSLDDAQTQYIEEGPEVVRFATDLYRENQRDLIFLCTDQSNKLGTVTIKQLLEFVPRSRYVVLYQRGRAMGGKWHQWQSHQGPPSRSLNVRV